MSSSPADLAFARFCRTGDAEALAAVFDATAPRLAVLAGHLAPGDAATVDDLVQATFVEAIRSAPRFAPGRPVLPWLVTILGRRAARLRRERGGRRPVADGDAVLAALVADAPDPARLAADAEAAAQVAQAIDRLDAPYREVVALRLVHDLAPVEIARALGRPLGTVHAQWHRGAEKLRRMLPVGLAIAFAALLQTPSLAATRAAVLAAARQSAVGAGAGAAVGAAAGGLVGVLTMKKILTGAAAVLLLALALPFLITPPSSGTGPIDPVPDLTAEVAALDARPTGQRASTEDAGPRRTTAAPTRSVDVTFRGRVVAHESGQPIAGATVRGRTRPWMTSIPPLPPERLAGANTEATATTDDDGRFAIALTPLPDRAFDVSIRAPGRATVVGWWEHVIRPGAIVDSGEISMALGAEVTLRVVDQDGAPLPGFGLQMREPDASPRSRDGAWSTPNFNGIQTSGPDGRTPAFTVSAGRYAFQFAEGTGHRLVRPDGFVVPTDRTSLTIDVHVEAPALQNSVGGVVVDTDGRPVVGVAVSVRQGGQSGTRSENTFHEGRFRIPGFLPERGPARVVRIGAGSADLPLEYRIVDPPTPDVAVGSEDLRIVVAPVETVTRRVRVLDGRHHRPLTRFRHGIVVVTEDDHGIRFGDARRGLPAVGLTGAHPDGTVELASPAGWKTLLTVAPEDPELAPVAFFPLDPDVGVDRVHEVRVPPIHHREVRVTAADGTPVVGSSVEWIQPVGHRSGLAGTIPLDDLLHGRDGATYIDALVDQDRTDATGTAHLVVSADTPRCRLRIRGATHREKHVAVDPEAAPDAPIHVVVEPAGRIAGAAAPLELLTALGPDARERAAAAMLVDPEQELTRLRPALELHGTSPSNDDVDVDQRLPDDGHFAFDGLPPGDYQLTLRADVEGIEPSWTIPALGAAETRRIELDLAAHVPARVRGRVLVNGAPPARRCQLRFGTSALWLGADGSFDAAFWPGRYELRLVEDWDPSHGTRIELERPGTLEIVRGDDREMTLDFARRSLRIVVHDALGEPAAGTWLALHAIRPDGTAGNQVGQLRRLDTDGAVEVAGSWREARHARLFTTAPFGPERDAARVAAIELGTVEFPVGAAAAEVVLQAPAGR